MSDEGAAGPAGWVVLRETLDPVEAELIAGLLNSGGIDAHVESRVFRQEPLPAIRAMSRVLIWVREEQREHAEEVLAHPAPPDDADDGDE
jgi:hypothetical protein